MYQALSLPYLHIFDLSGLHVLRQLHQGRDWRVWSVTQDSAESYIRGQALSDNGKRRHLLFVEMVRERLRGAPARQPRGSGAADAPGKAPDRVGSGSRPADLPVMGPGDAY